MTEKLAVNDLTQALNCARVHFMTLQRRKKKNIGHENENESIFLRKKDANEHTHT